MWDRTQCWRSLARATSGDASTRGTCGRFALLPGVKRLALPLIADDKTFGALTIYSREPVGFFDEGWKRAICE